MPIEKILSTFRKMINEIDVFGICNISTEQKEALKAAVELLETINQEEPKN